MAFSFVAVAKPTGTRPRASLAVFDVTATADADTGGDVTHGLGIVPEVYWMVPLLAAYYTSVWTITAVSSTVVTVTKGTAVGSGTANAQMRLFVERPHTLTR